MSMKHSTQCKASDFDDVRCFCVLNDLLAKILLESKRMGDNRSYLKAVKYMRAPARSAETDDDDSEETDEKLLRSLCAQKGHLARRVKDLEETNFYLRTETERLDLKRIQSDAECVKLRAHAQRIVDEEYGGALGTLSDSHRALEQVSANRKQALSQMLKMLKLNMWAMCAMSLLAVAGAPIVTCIVGASIGLCYFAVIRHLRKKIGDDLG